VNFVGLLGGEGDNWGSDQGYWPPRAQRAQRVCRTLGTWRWVSRREASADPGPFGNGWHRLCRPANRELDEIGKKLVFRQIFNQHLQGERRLCCRWVDESMGKWRNMRPVLPALRSFSEGGERSRRIRNCLAAIAGFVVFWANNAGSQLARQIIRDC
jgi:hypothetical protein